MVIAVANKLLKVVWVMLTCREMYSGVNQRKYEEKLNNAGFGPKIPYKLYIGR